MNWISFALQLVKLASLIFDQVKAKSLIKIGEDRAALATYKKMEEISTKLKAVDVRYDKMSIDDIKNDIQMHGDFRD